jgi:hypothetical protein
MRDSLRQTIPEKIESLVQINFCCLTDNDPWLIEGKRNLLLLS